MKIIHYLGTSVKFNRYISLLFSDLCKNHYEGIAYNPVENL
jgi:hypothetical protein